MIIDTHCHLYVEEFSQDIDQVIQRASENGVQKFYLPAIDSHSTDVMLELEHRFPQHCVAMMGLHPCSVKENYRDELMAVEDWLQKRKFVAIGECGLDFYWDKTFIKEQYAALERQIELAIQYHIPIVLHTRSATQETIDVIKQHINSGLTGIFHCFGGSRDEALQIVEMGFYLGIGGVVTYKNSGLAAVIREISLSHIVLETDAPYFSPVPFRGRRNESSYLKIIAEKIAVIKECSVAEVAEKTTANALSIFGH